MRRTRRHGKYADETAHSRGPPGAYEETRYRRVEREKTDPAGQEAMLGEQQGGGKRGEGARWT